MRIRAEVGPLPPHPTWSWSMTTPRPALCWARWNAIEAPITPAPTITKSAVRGPLSLMPLPSESDPSSSRAEPVVPRYDPEHPSLHPPDAPRLGTDRDHRSECGTATNPAPGA